MQKIRGILKLSVIATFTVTVMARFFAVIVVVFVGIIIAIAIAIVSIRLASFRIVSASILLPYTNR